MINQHCDPPEWRSLSRRNVWAALALLCPSDCNDQDKPHDKSERGGGIWNYKFDETFEKMFSAPTIAKNPIMQLIKHHNFSNTRMGSQTPIFEYAFQAGFEGFNVP